jgi:hypothetical protein
VASVEEWNRLVNGFDVEALAGQLQSVGAAYYIITIGQNSGYFLAPNAAYDRLVGIRPSKCSRRDLVADLAVALEKRGIKLIVYLPSGAPARDAVAVKALEWQNGAHRNREFQLKWEQVIREWSLQWGAKVAGWFFDGAYWPNTMYRMREAPNFVSFAAAARAGNPASAISFSPGTLNRPVSLTPEEDFIAGEMDDPARIMYRRIQDGLQDDKQVQILSFLGRRWGSGSPRFSTEQVIEFSRAAWKYGAAFTWDAPPQPDGTISQTFLDQLAAAGKAAGRR